MSADPLSQLFMETVINVLEETIYALVNEVADVCSNDTMVTESVVSFSGSLSGTIALEVETSAVTSLVDDLLGSHSIAVPTDISGEAVGELANIIAGQFLQAWRPETSDYDIGIPDVQAKQHGETHLATVSQRCVTRLRTDRGIRIAAGLSLETWS